MDQTVELYCGTEKPFSQVAEALGYATFTVDVNPENEPNLAGRISAALAKDIPASPLIVWAAPPYHEVFHSSECWDSDGSLHPRTEEAEAAINAIRGTIGLLTALKPTWWFIEHPKSLVRKMPLFTGFNRGYPTRNRHTIEHRNFGGEKGDTSDIWTNAFWWLPNSPDSEGEKKQGKASANRVPPYVYAQMLGQFDNYQRTKTLSV